MAITQQEVEDRLDEWELGLPIDERLTRAEAWLPEFSVGAPGRARLLNYLGELQRLEGRPAEALARYREATADGGETVIDPRAMEVDALLELGDTDGVDAHLRELRRISAAGTYRGIFHEFIADVLESHDRLKDAHRWHNLGLRDLDPDRADPDLREEHHLRGRSRVRRALGLAKDRFDLLADDVEAMRRLQDEDDEHVEDAFDDDWDDHSDTPIRDTPIR